MIKIFLFFIENQKTGILDSLDSYMWMFVYNVLMYIAIFYIRSLEKKFMEKMFSFFNTRNIWLVSYFTGYICICYCWTWKYYDDVRKLFEEKYESLKTEIIKKG